MQPGLLEAKLGAVEQDAARERAGVEYIVGIINANETALRGAFVPDGTEEEQVGELLYTRVSQTLDGLAAEYTRTIGVVIRHMTPGAGGDYPVVKLGWARFVAALPGIEDCPSDKTFPHVLRPTEAGVEVVNGLRVAQGKKTLEEQQRINRERWDQAIAASNREE